MSIVQNRNRLVIELLSKAKYATIKQIAELFFTGVKNEEQRYNKAWFHLKKMTEQGLIYRSKLPGDYYIYSLQPFTYHAGIQRYLDLVDELIKINGLAEGKLIWEIDGKKADLWAKDNRQEWLVNYVNSVIQWKQGSD